jgi:methyl-accepting chemotaxis protein
MTRRIAMTSAEAPAAVSAAVERTAAVPAFFQHHGVMAPGIRLFRVIGFPAKMAWVSAAFVLPLMFLAWSLWSTANESIAFSSKELQGTQYVRSVVALLDAAQQRRRAATVSAADLPEVAEKVAVAFKTAAEQEHHHGRAFATGDRFKAVQSLQGQLASQPVPGSPTATFAAHTAFIEAVQKLLADVADGSNLTLDPDLDSFYLMSAAVLQQPALIEQLGRLRGMGNAVLRQGILPSEQRDTLSAALASANNYLIELKRALGRARDADASLAQQAVEQEVLDANASFLAAVKAQIMGSAIAGDAPAFLAQANKAIVLNYSLNEQILRALDAKLVRRVAMLNLKLRVQIGVSVAGVLLAIYLLTAFYRVTRGGIAEVAAQLGEIAAGNLTKRPRPWGRDEVAQLMTTLAQTTESLRGVVHGVRHSAGEIEVASCEIASASVDLSRRTEETAAHLQRTSSAMEQINSTVRQTADTAAGASSIVESNAELATRGGQIVGNVVTTMDGIRDSSSRIGEIIGVIDSIAFQTNILALNAAVEAARAGEQGRGFAVVASEVRALAQRTAAAAREVKGLIQSSVERVQSGASVVGQAGTTMSDVVRTATRMKALMGEISHAANEQSTGLADVSRSVVELDTTTQQNAALVEQTAAAASSLRDSAARLNQEVAYFRIG